MTSQNSSRASLRKSSFPAGSRLSKFLNEGFRLDVATTPEKVQKRYLIHVAGYTLGLI